MSILNDIARLRERPQVYLRFLQRTISRGGFTDALRSRFPFRFSDPKFPRIVGLEFTNFCNLKCSYCAAQTPEVKGRVGFMNPDTFARVVTELRSFPVQTLRVIGGGEPTAHPRFAEYAAQLRGIARMTTLTTNGQYLSEPVAREAVRTFDVVEISVGGGSAAEFEENRTGASFQKLMDGVHLFRSLKAKQKSKTLLHIRIMLRASDKTRIDELRAFWGQFADTTSTQALVDRVGGSIDVFIDRFTNDQFHRCEYPFKVMGISWNGEIPLCSYIEERLKVSNGGLLLGNIKGNTLLEIWHGSIAQQYRNAHRCGDRSQAPLCIGCNDYWGQRDSKRMTSSTSAKA
jgi:MoaA/NifB/PqqE/SkfB family radical SAM enzyme